MTAPALTSHEITQLLRAWGGGDREALDQLIPLVYEELHRQAARYLRRERPGHTLQTTALVNEAYFKLADQKHARWENRAQFYAVAARLMRRILVDHARAKRRDKRGAGGERLPLDEALAVAGDEKGVDLVALDEALTRLAAIDERQARVVELRYFAGLEVEETAEALGISPATVKREWSMARAWLHRELGAG